MYLGLVGNGHDLRVLMGFKVSSSFCYHITWVPHIHAMEFDVYANFFKVNMS